MLLDTLVQSTFVNPAQFVFTVPGDRYWTVRTIIAVVSRDNPGFPDRSYTLTVATSTGPVAIVPATDDGLDPGTETITWCDAPAADIAVGDIAVVVAPMRLPTLYPGYTITGTIVNAAGADTWTHATLWYEYALTGQP